MDITEFPSGVIEHLGWYVYRLNDPRDGSTFYVGKGKGNRVFAHMRGEVAATDDDELLSNKLKQIREIRLAGLEVIHVIHRHGMTDEKTAYEVEAALIDAYPGLTNIMNGAGSNEFGAAHVKELIATYQPETITFHHKALMISVNRSAKDSELYDAAKVDGANKLQSIWHITVPGILPTYVVMFLLAVSNILSNGFDQYFMFYNPMVADRIEVLDYYVYKVGFYINDYSYSITLGMLKSLIGIALLFMSNAISKKIRGNSII